MATEFVVSQTKTGESPLGTYPSFDEAYEAAMAKGGDLFVVPMLGTGAGKPRRPGPVEYVPAVQS